MTKRNIPVYFEEFQSLVLCRLDSLVINITKYEQNTKVLTRFRSSSQHRLRRVRKLLRRQLRITSQRRWLPNSRAYLDKLNRTAHRHRWTVRQPHPRDLHQQIQAEGHQVPHPTCLTNALHAKQSGDSISPFFSARGCFFPLATKLSTNHYATK